MKTMVPESADSILGPQHQQGVISSSAGYLAHMRCLWCSLRLTITRFVLCFMPLLKNIFTGDDSPDDDGQRFSEDK